MKNKSLYLIDGSAMFYRAYFAFIRNPLINSKGEDTSATYGFVNSILKVIQKENPDYIAVVFDTKAPTFRHKMYTKYKANRTKMPEELVVQIPRIKESVNALNIVALEMEGYEADDIIGTIANDASKQGMKVWCVTGDKDFFQLVNDNVKVYNPKSADGKPILYGREEVKEKFGVYPELVIDKLALMGDASDNVPGVPGIGPKTADTLLTQFGSLEGILENHDQIKAKGARTKIADNIELAKLSKELVTIELKTPIDYKLEDLKRKEFNYELSKELFMELEFGRILKDVLAGSGVEADTEVKKPEIKKNYTTITSLDELEKLVAKLSKLKEIAIDTETTSLNTFEAKLVGVSISDKSNAGYYIPVGHTTDAEDNLPLQKTLDILKPLLINTKVQKFGQNIKYDLKIFHNYDIEIEPVSFDTMLAGYLINPSARENSLTMLALKYFDYQMQPISDLIGSGKNQKTFDIVPIKTATFYAVEDSDYTYQLRGAMAPILEELDMDNLYYNIELPLVKILTDVEETGIKVDVNYLAKLSLEMEAKLEKLTAQIYEIAGEEFNINSTQQLSHILFEKLNLPTKGKTAKKTGYSTDVKVLEELAKIHDLPKFLLDYRQFSKLPSTYVDAIPKLVRPDTNRVHTSFNQTVAATGRLSSTDPNLQNIPIRTEEGRQIRKAFIPKDNEHTLLVADYSQIELRILAHYANDKTLLKAFKNNEDIHKRTAAEVYDVTLDEVTADMRRAAKTANFAIIYGVSAYGLSQQSGMSLDESKHFIDRYFHRYPGIKDYMDTMKEFARQKGYVITHYNRRRYLPEINSTNYQMRQFAERIAINTPIQGTAADIIKLAMIKIHKKMEGMKSKMVLQVHDELVFDVYKPELKKVEAIVREGMEQVADFEVPLIADIGVGDNWLDAK